MTENAQATVTTDSANVNRTGTGEITTAPATEAPKSEVTTTQEQGKSLLNQTETKAETKAETKTEEGKTEGKKDAKTEGAPEKYADYKLPEGFELIPEVKSRVDEMFKGMGLSQENAQKLVDFYVKETEGAFQRPFDEWTKTTDAWAKESLDHPDLRGKLGAGKEVTVRLSKFLDSIGDPKLAADFRAQMDLTGAGNHHAFIRVLDWAARQLTEGTHAAGNGPGPSGQAAPGSRTQPTAAQAMYPNLPSANR